METKQKYNYEQLLVHYTFAVTKVAECERAFDAVLVERATATVLDTYNSKLGALAAATNTAYKELKTWRKLLVYATPTVQ